MAFTGPYGEFVLDEAPETELICVGGGCGMAPLRALLRHVRQVNPQMKCWLFFGARTAEDLMYMEEFQQLSQEMPNLHVHYALSEPGYSPGWEGEIGMIHESVAAHVGSDGRRQAFLCGPPKMVEALMNVFDEKSLPRDRIFFDEF